MKLTRVERWMLSNQYQILAALNPDEASYYERAQEAIDSGYEPHYEMLCERIRPDEEALSEDQCKEVVDILDMFSSIKSSYERLETKPDVEPWRREFRGFDGNYETKLMGYARYYCTFDGGRYQDLGDIRFNSHAPSLDRYREMLREWRSCGDKYELSADEIVRITSA